MTDIDMTKATPSEHDPILGVLDAKPTGPDAPTDEVLELSLRIVREERFWTTGDLCDSYGKVCALGAVGVAVYGWPWDPGVTAESREESDYKYVPLNGSYRWWSYEHLRDLEAVKLLGAQAKTCLINIGHDTEENLTRVPVDDAVIALNDSGHTALNTEEKSAKHHAKVVLLFEYALATARGTEPPPLPAILRDDKEAQEIVRGEHLDTDTDDAA